MAAAGRRWVRVTATAATALIAAAAAAAAAAAVSRRSTHAREKRAPRRLQRIVERRRREGHKAGWSRSDGGGGTTHARENRPRVTRRCDLSGDLNSRQTWYRSRSDGGGGTHHSVRLGVDVKPDEAEEEERGGGEAV